MGSPSPTTTLMLTFNSVEGRAVTKQSKTKKEREVLWKRICVRERWKRIREYMMMIETKEPLIYNLFFIDDKSDFVLKKGKTDHRPPHTSRLHTILPKRINPHNVSFNNMISLQLFIN